MKISEETIKEFEKALEDHMSFMVPKRQSAYDWMEGWIQAKGIWRDFESAENSYRFIQIINKYYE